MSLFAVNPDIAHIRGIHAPECLTVKQLKPDYNPASPPRNKEEDRVVAVIHQTEDGGISIEVPDDVLIFKLK